VIVKPILLAVAIVTLLVSACNSGMKVGPGNETRLPTDTSMIQHENPANKSSTSAGIGMQ
jgi:hypothetical protein